MMDNLDMISYPLSAIILCYASALLMHSAASYYLSYADCLSLQVKIALPVSVGLLVVTF